MKVIILNFIILLQVVLAEKANYNIEVLTGTNLASTAYEIKLNKCLFSNSVIKSAVGFDLAYNNATDSDNTSTKQIASESSLSYHSNIFISNNLYVTDNFSFILDAYVGAYILKVDGKYVNETYDQDYTEDYQKFFWDYGTRLGISYELFWDIGIQFSIQKSFRNLFNGNGFLFWLSDAKDAPLRIMYGLSYKF